MEINRLDDFNQNYKLQDYNYSLVERFEEMVKDYSNKTALNFNGNSITYLELNEIANSYASLFIKMGITKYSRVVLYFDESLEMISMIIAVLKTGASYIPLPSSFPFERILGISIDAECFAIVSHSQLISDTDKKKTTCPVIFVDQQQLEPLSANIGIYHKACDCVYNIFTSGSTGKPKGVSISQANLINFTDYCIDSCRLTSNDNGTKFAGYGFDASIIEIFPILLVGGTLHILDKDIKLDPIKLNQYFEQHEISYAFLPTQFCELFTTNVVNNSLRNLMVGGDKLRKIKLGNYNLINVYGPTETTVAATVFYVDREDYQNIPIGKVITNYTTYIVNEQMERIAIGEIGELCIGGDGVGIGYINLPEPTTEKFIKNPFVTEQDVKLNRNGIIYKTGDLARYLPDGNIEFLGRNDFQVKIRGFRIELGEIENCLLNFPGISDCLVMAIKDANDNSHLCAYYVAETEINNDIISAALAKVMPEYMIPATYIHMIKFSINANGKIDRKVLPLPDLSLFMTEYVAPINNEQQLICSEFMNVLGMEKIGVNDDFYHLGGNSIKAIILVSKLQQYFEIKVADIFELKTPAKLSQLPRSKFNNKIIKYERRKEYPLSFAQERMYIVDQVSDRSTLYNVPQRITITGDLDKERLGLALDRLVERHSCLRSNFIEQDGKLKQVVNEEFTFIKDFSKASLKELNKLISNFVRPFNLSHELLIRVHLIQITSSHHELLIDAPHIAFDGGSLQPFLRDLTKLYGDIGLPSIPIEYVDFAIWQREDGGVQWIKDKESYWFEQFSKIEIEPLNLPYDYSRPMVPNYMGNTVSIKIDGQLFKSLDELATSYNLSLYSVCLFAVNSLFHIYSGQDNLILGTATSGRTHSEISEMVGMFVNTLPFLTEFNSKSTILELLQNTQKNVLSLIANQDYPIESLMQRLGLSSQNGYNPLFNVVFNYLEGYQAVIAEDDILWQYAPWSENKIAKFDLTLTANQSNNEINLEFNYAVSLFKRETIEKMAGHLLNIFKQFELVATLGHTINKLDILGNDERKQLLVDFNNTLVNYPRDKTVLDLFEEIVTRYPEKIAVMAKNGSLNYYELNQQAERIAGYLIEHGIKVDELVGILVDNQLEMMVAVIAVIKAGAAYVPMAYDTPLERVSY